MSGLEAEVDGKAVALSWTAVPDADVVGYVVRRDGERLTEAVPQEEASSIAATSRSSQAALAFDGNPSSAWVPEAGPAAAWTVTFPAPVLVERLHLRFAKSEGTDPVLPAAYTVRSPLAGPGPEGRARPRQHAGHGRAPAALALPDHRDPRGARVPGRARRGRDRGARRGRRPAS